VFLGLIRVQSDATGHASGELVSGLERIYIGIVVVVVVD
jgi:hypothetical protein